MSHSHHSFYSNHIRHQLSGVAALWGLGAPRRCTTHPHSSSMEACQPLSKSDTLFNWFIYLVITACIEQEATSSCASDRDKLEGIKMVFTPVSCNYARRSPNSYVFPLCPGYDRPLPKVRLTGLQVGRAAAAVTAGLFLMQPMTSRSDWLTPGLSGSFASRKRWRGGEWRNHTNFSRPLEHRSIPIRVLMMNSNHLAKLPQTLG